MLIKSVVEILLLLVDYGRDVRRLLLILIVFRVTHDGVFFLVLFLVLYRPRFFHFPLRLVMSTMSLIARLGKVLSNRRKLGYGGYLGASLVRRHAGLAMVLRRGV
jgi:hypothetical protein